MQLGEPDLSNLGASDLSPERESHELTAETHTEDRSIGRDRMADQRTLMGQPRSDVVLPRCHRATEKDKAVDVEGKLGRDRFARVGLDLDHVDADLCPPLPQQSGRVGRVVAYDENANGSLIGHRHSTGR